MVLLKPIRSILRCYSIKFDHMYPHCVEIRESERVILLNHLYYNCHNIR